MLERLRTAGKPVLSSSGPRNRSNPGAAGHGNAGGKVYVGALGVKHARRSLPQDSTRPLFPAADPGDLIAKSMRQIREVRLSKEFTKCCSGETLGRLLVECTNRSYRRVR